MFLGHAKAEYRDAPIAKDILAIADNYVAKRNMKSIRAVKVLANKSVQRKQLPEEQAKNALATLDALEESLNYTQVRMRASEVIERFKVSRNKKLTSG